MTPTRGNRYITRGGAVIEVVSIQDTGLIVYDSNWKKLGTSKLVICKFVQYAGGEPITDEPPRKFAVHEDGQYLSDMPHALDLVREVQEVRAA